MKTSISFASRLLFVLLSVLIGLMSFSQDTTTSISVTRESTTTTTDWYTQPWVWIVGGAVFLIILIALLRPGAASRRDREVTKTTVIKDND